VGRLRAAADQRLRKRQPLIDGDRRRRAGRKASGVDAVQDRQRILDLRRQSTTARFQPFSNNDAQDEQQAGAQRASEEQEEDLPVVQANLDLVFPPLDVAERGFVHACLGSVSQAHDSSSFLAASPGTLAARTLLVWVGVDVGVGDPSRPFAHAHAGGADGPLNRIITYM
jgi:hypothetical protein